MALHFGTFTELPLSGRFPRSADYIHYLADLLATSNSRSDPVVKNGQGFGRGVEANCGLSHHRTSEVWLAICWFDVNPIAVSTCKYHFIKSNPCF